MLTLLVIITGRPTLRDSTTDIPKFSPCEAKSIALQFEITPHFNSPNIASEKKINLSSLKFETSFFIYISYLLLSKGPTNKIGVLNFFLIYLLNLL